MIFNLKNCYYLSNNRINKRAKKSNEKFDEQAPSALQINIDIKDEINEAHSSSKNKQIYVKLKDNKEQFD